MRRCDLSHPVGLIGLAIVNDISRNCHSTELLSFGLRMKLNQDILYNFIDPLDIILHFRGKNDFFFIVGRLKVVSMLRLQYTIGLRIKNIELVKLNL